MLKENEISDVTGQIRTVNFEMNGMLAMNPDLEITEAGCGIGGADMTLSMKAEDEAEIVHCADCIHRHEDGYCDSPVGNVGYSRVDDDDFCSCGYSKKNEPSDGR